MELDTETWIAHMEGGVRHLRIPAFVELERMRCPGDLPQPC